MNRYELKKSTEKSNWWVCTDIQNLVVCKFEMHKFNETQKVSIIEESPIMVNNLGALGIAKILKEMGDWLVVNHPNIVF